MREGAVFGLVGEVRAEDVPRVQQSLLPWYRGTSPIRKRYDPLATLGIVLL